MKSTELYHQLNEIGFLAQKGIYDILKEHNLETFDFTKDLNGNGNEDEGYDEDWVLDNQICCVCADKYCNYDGYITNVKIQDARLVFSAVDCDFNAYYHDNIFLNESLYIDILYQLEIRLNN